MRDIDIGLNLGFADHAEKSFDEGIRLAAEYGYKYVEPWVITGYDPLALRGSYHVLSMQDDPLEVKAKLDANGLMASAVSAHCPLMRPEISIPYLSQAIRYASDIGAPVVNTDEGTKPDWMSEKEAFTILAYTLRLVLETAERYGINIGLQPRGHYSARRETLLRLLDLSDSPCWMLNWDPADYYIRGEDDLYDTLEIVADRVCHVHARDVSIKPTNTERGAVTGTPIGCACGEGVIDWPRIIQTLRRTSFHGVVSVECGEIDQAQRSIKFLQRLIG